MNSLVDLASKGNACVLLTGPTGSGKSCLAKRIHDASSRVRGPFVSVNLASLHEGTFESELFGHERGAFTGADSRRAGRLEAANGGTVFLDEVGELGPKQQARLLEFLQSRVITRLGGNREIRLDVRVIAATHRNLAAMISKNEFREDLFHRLRVIPIELKPLSERCDEFGELVHACLADVCATNGKHVFRIAPEVAELLERHDWPGNFRELRNVLEFSVLSATEGDIRLKDLPAWFVTDFSSRQSGGMSEIDLAETIRHFTRLDYTSALSLFEKNYLCFALKRNYGRVNRTARQIGMNKTTLIRRMRAYGLSPMELLKSS